MLFRSLVEINRITLELQKYVVRYLLDKKFVMDFFDKDSECFVQFDPFLNSFSVDLTRHIYTRDQLVTKTIEVPTSVFQELKSKYAPEWFKKHFPVRLKTHSFNFKLTECFPTIAHDKNPYKTLYFVERFNNEVR